MMLDMVKAYDGEDTDFDGIEQLPIPTIKRAIRIS